MNKKLTLSLDDKIIKQAKSYANEHNESLSKLVEKYFVYITLQDNQEQNDFSPIIEELIGSIKFNEDVNVNDAKFEYLKEKYLND